MAPITIFVQPHVRKFFLKEYGKEPIYVRADSNIGRLFVLALSKDNLLPIDGFDVEEIANPKTTKSKETKLKFALSFRVSQGKLTVDNMNRLGFALEAEFKKAIYYFSLGRRTLHNSERRAVETFLQLYNISDDTLDSETAVKMAQRERKEKAEMKVVPNM